MIPDLVTAAELAPNLKIRPAKLRALANRGELPFYRVGRAMLFSPADVEAYLDELASLVGNRMDSRRARRRNDLHGRVPVVCPSS